MNDASHPAQIGRYQILRLIGAGGMGDVFLARDPNIERQLAIKTVRLRGAPAEVADHKLRLLREAKAAGRLVHANVVTLFDAGEADGVLYLAFEFVDGPDLGRRMKSNPPLTLRHSLLLVRQIAEGLAFAHHQGIIHRDIKPSNILIDPRGQAKIADFGLAKMNDESMELTRTGSVVGSPQYMSPEQVRGDSLDGRTDIFSLGVLLYELMSSMRPFGGQTISTLVYEILSKEPPALAQVRPDLPPAIAGLTQVMLAKELQARVSSAAEVVARLDQVLASTPAALLDAPAVTPVDANAKTALLSRTPTPGPAAASPPPPPPLAASVAPGVPGSPPAAPPRPTAPPTVPMPSAAPLSSSRAPAAPPPPPPQHASVQLPSVSAPTATGRAAKATGSKKWMFALGGGILLVVLAVGFWWLGSLFQKGKTTDSDTQTAEVTGTATGQPSETLPVAAATTSDAKTLDALSASEDGGGPTTSNADEPVTESVLGTGSETAPTGGESTISQAQPTSQVTAPPRQQTPPPRSSATGPSTQPATRPPATATAAPTTTAPTTTAPTASSPTTASPATRPTEDVASLDADLAAFDAAAGEAHREMSTGRYFKFMVEPDNAIVRLWQRGEERQTVLGQAKGYSAKGRDSRSFELPEDGDYLFTFIADGFPNLSVLVHATSGRGLGAQVIRASMANGVQGSQGPKSLKVSRSLGFNGFPENARVLIDGVVQGPASKWPGGRRATGANNLQLERGRHRLRIEAEGYEPYEVLVEVSPGARRSAIVRYDLRRAN